MKGYVAEKIQKYLIDPEAYDIDFKMYGWNAVSGSAPQKGYLPAEIGLVMAVTAQTQELATRIAKIYNPYLLHFPVNMEEQLPTFAFPFSPAETERGAVYEFMLNHSVEVNEPMELFHREVEVIA